MAESRQTIAEPMLGVSDIHVYYGAIHAVKGISLEVYPDEIVTLIGANGAGKSSVIRAIMGLTRCAAEELTYHSPREGEAPVSLLGKPAEEHVRLGIALSPEGRRILPHLTVKEKLRLGALPGQAPTACLGG